MEHRLILFVFLLCAFLISAAASGMVIPRILSRSLKRGWLDKPDYRKMHSGYASRLGGLAFLPETLLSIAVVIAFYFLTQASDFFVFTPIPFPQWLFLLLAAAVVYVTGAIDDLKNLSYRVKLVAITVAAVFAMLSGLHVDTLDGFLGIHQLPVWLDCCLTLVLIVGVVVALNLIDGIDGLASGLTSLSLCYYGAWFVSLNEFSYALGVFALLGAIVPFFFYNTYSKSTRHRIFMGDTGSMTLGLALVVCALACHERSVEADNISFVHAVSPLLVPCLDALRVFALRILSGVSPFCPDKTHLHHKLVALYGSQNKARRIILLVAVVYVICNYFLAAFININILLLTESALYFLWNMSLSHRLKKRERSVQKQTK
ncbi:MAG: MraY family glycosyltransferase [Bacteroidales bacterium]|nr:MraY family glycosyltransferase [Bacteroidales bacterium]